MLVVTQPLNIKHRFNSWRVFSYLSSCLFNYSACTLCEHIVHFHHSITFCTSLSYKQISHSVKQWLCCVHSESDIRSQWTSSIHFKRSHNAVSVPQERLFSGFVTSLTLIVSACEEMKEANRWSLSDVGADYLISLSNWPESCCYCFASAELTYLNMISLHKSIWGFVFIFVCWECSRKCKRLIHKNLNLWWQNGYDFTASSGQ